MTTLKRGDRIYYTGDMANIEGEGAVSRVHQPGPFTSGMQYDILMDDGREFRRVFASGFDPGPGRRFWPLNEYHNHMEERRAAFVASLKR